MTFLFIDRLVLLPQEAPEAASIGDMLLLAVVGMSVVFVSLGVIGGIMLLLGRLLNRAEATEALEVAPAGPVDTEAPARATGLPGPADAHTLAILTAAAYVAVGRPVRLRRVTFINENTVSAWKEVGRVSVQSSHNIRRSL